MSDTSGKPEFREITKNEIRELLGRMRRPADSHKGDFGRVLVVAGSHGMAGAAVLCARAALRTGSGLVTVSISESLFPIVQCAVPEATCVGRDFSGGSNELAPEMLARYDAVAIGPGLGTSDEARALVRHVISGFAGPMVVDADALNIVSGFGGSGSADAELTSLRPNVIITPHPGEAARLLGYTSAAEVQANRAAAFVELESRFGCCVVLKGAGTLVSPKRINTTGNPGMATPGSGDVLTGILVSLLGQGLPVETAAAAGVWLHGHAGDIMAERYGEAGLIAGDIAEGVAYARK